MQICEVGVRDGLQNQKRIYSARERADLVMALADAGLRHIEAVSFANPARVPQMADPELLLDLLDVPEGVVLAGLAMNRKGVDRALATRLHEVRYVIVASETFSQRNQNASVAETIATFLTEAERVKASGRRMTAVIAASFGCPFEGEVPADRISDIVKAIAPVEPDAVILADTIGVGVPRQVTALAKRVREAFADCQLGFHFHNSRNTGFANAATAMAIGADTLDASIGGLGGCPFAPGATGNIATEDLAYLVERSGIETGVDSDKLFAITRRLATDMPEGVTGQLHKAGLFPRKSD